MHRTMIVILASSLFVVACKKDVKPVPAPIAATASAPSKSDPARDEAVQRLVENFSRVHFGYDSSTLDGQAQRLLSENAAILQRFPDIRIEIQGHADERGTTDYNLALGQRRASSVQSALTRLGVTPSRVATVTYGEERPLSAGQGEVAWAQNRRAEFRVLTPNGSVSGTTGG